MTPRVPHPVYGPGCGCARGWQRGRVAPGPAPGLATRAVPLAHDTPVPVSPCPCPCGTYGGDRSWAGVTLPSPARHPGTAPRGGPCPLSLVPVPDLGVSRPRGPSAPALALLIDSTGGRGAGPPRPRPLISSPVGSHHISGRRTRAPGTACPRVPAVPSPLGLSPQTPNPDRVHAPVPPPGSTGAPSPPQSLGPHQHPALSPRWVTPKHQDAVGGHTWPHGSPQPDTPITSPQSRSGVPPLSPLRPARWHRPVTGHCHLLVNAPATRGSRRVPKTRLHSRPPALVLGQGQAQPPVSWLPVSTSPLMTAPCEPGSAGPSTHIERRRARGPRRGRGRRWGVINGNGATCAAARPYKRWRGGRRTTATGTPR